MKNDAKNIVATGNPNQEYIVVCLGTEIDSMKTYVGYEAAVAAVKEVRDEIAERFDVDNPERDETWLDICDMDRKDGFKLYNMDEVYQTAFIVKQPKSILDKIKYRLLLIKNAIRGSNDLVDSCVDEIESLVGAEKPDKPYQAELFYGYQECEDGIYHSFELCDPSEKWDADDAAEHLAEQLDCTPDDDRFNWNSMYVNIPDALIERIRRDFVYGASKNESTEKCSDTLCPVCGGAIDPKGGYVTADGLMKLDWTCPSCRSVGMAVYDIHDNKELQFSRHWVISCGEKAIECDSETCVFNPDGICKYKAVYGKEPVLHDDGCSGYCGKEADVWAPGC